MNDHSMQEQLKTIFANVNEWLKFAEAKNTVILAADAAAAFGAVTILLGKDNNLALWLYIYLHSFVSCVALSATAALLSIVPKTKMFFSGRYGEKRATDNLLFYGDIAKYSPEEYLSILCSKHGQPKTTTGLDLDFAQQIVINSRITVTKYGWFEVGMWLALAAIATPVLAGALFLLIRQKNYGVSRSLLRLKNKG